MNHTDQVPYQYPKVRIDQKATNNIFGESLTEKADWINNGTNKRI